MHTYVCNTYKYSYIHTYIYSCVSQGLSLDANGFIRVHDTLGKNSLKSKP
jgi:hypothetical protein